MIGDSLRGRDSIFGTTYEYDYLGDIEGSLSELDKLGEIHAGLDSVVYALGEVSDALEGSISIQCSE